MTEAPISIGGRRERKTATYDAFVLEDELLRLLARQGRGAGIPVLLADVLLAAMVATRVQHWTVWLWLAAATCVFVLRWTLVGELLTSSRLSRQRKLRAALLLSAINGVVHGASVLFAPALGDLERAVQSILLLGLCAGSVATTAGYRPIFLAFVVPTLVPLCLAWAIGTGSAEHRWIELWTAALILLFGMLLLGLAKDAFRLFSESFQIRHQQADLNRQLRAALDDAMTANAAKTRFLASASHDLRQPMHTLTLFTAALSMRSLDEGSRNIAQHLHTAVRFLGAQLDALLDVSKLDAGVVAVRPASFSLTDFLRRIEAEYRSVAGAKRLTLCLECPPQARCNSDELLLGRIVRNLVDNAIKYTPTGGVTLRVEAAGAAWLLKVVDTGVGIPEHEQQQVFEEFYQLDNPERDRSRGLGLGLSIVKRLAELLEVNIEMRSQPNEGTTFSIALPVGSQEQETLHLHGDATGDSLAGIRILVLDDEEAVRKGMLTLLEAYGAQVQLAGSIAEAVDEARRERPDIVLADLRLRGTENGIAAVAELRRIHAGLPAVLISGDTAPDRLQDAAAAAIPLLHKPVSIDALRQVIAREISARIE